MDFVKTSAETYISQKINIRQLLVVLRIVLIGRSKNLDNGLEDVIIKAPIYLSGGSKICLHFCLPNLIEVRLQRNSNMNWKIKFLTLPNGRDNLQL